MAPAVWRWRPGAISSPHSRSTSRAAAFRVMCWPLGRVDVWSNAMATISCYGYDINLSQRDMSYAAIPDLREQYHPGDELTCVVKQFDRRAGTLEISVKETVPNPFDEASLRHPVGCRRRASIAGKYANVIKLVTWFQGQTSNRMSATGNGCTFSVKRA